MPVETYLRLGDLAQVERQNDAFDGFSDRHLGNQSNGQPMHGLLSWRLTPLRSLHLADPRSQGALITLGAVGLLALMVAAINHINLATALAGLRAREVAVRRTLGATRRVLVGQFLIEALLTAILAWTGGLALVELTLPLVNAATGLALAIPYGDGLGFLLGCMAMVVGAVLLSGVYPALLLSQFQPAQVMASSRASSGGRIGLWVREGLVVGQFAVVVILFVLTWGFFSQIEHLQQADLGFRRNGLLMTVSSRDPTMTPALLHQLWAAFRGVPGVTALGSGEDAPGDENGVSHVVVTMPEQPQEVSLLRSSIEADFFTTYDATLLAGRFLTPDRAEDDEPADGSPQHIVLNAKATRLLGFSTPEDAVHKIIDSYGKRLEIVGVVGDLYFRSPKNELPGIYYYRRPETLTHQVTAVRYEGFSEPEMREKLKAAWRSVAPDIPLELISADDNLDHYYRADRDRSRLFAIGAVGAALIGCLGLYGIAVFSTSRRLLEVAVRKVLGASRRAIVKLLVGQFMKPVLLANLLAWPIGYIVLSDWLQQFNDRAAIGVLPFIASGGAALLLAVATVAAHAVNAANAAPAKALRGE
jgi:putative ABC transport system permease protein